MFALSSAAVVAEKPNRVHTHSDLRKNHETAAPCLVGVDLLAVRVVAAVVVAEEAAAEVEARKAAVEAVASTLIAVVVEALIFLRILFWSPLHVKA